MSRFDIGVSIALWKENGNFQRRMSGQLGNPAVTTLGSYPFITSCMVGKPRLLVTGGLTSNLTP
jgi:hypothetical protein